MTTNKPEVVAWGNDPRKMSEADLLPCPNCNHRAGRATKRAANGLPFVGLWKVSCQRPECPLAMIYFHPVEWNRLPRIRQSEYAAPQAECEKLRTCLAETAGVAVTMLYESHKADTIKEFTVEQLSQMVETTKHLAGANVQVEKVYRKAWDMALTNATTAGAPSRQSGARQRPGPPDACAAKRR